MSDEAERRHTGGVWCNFCGGEHAPSVCPNRKPCTCEVPNCGCSSPEQAVCRTCGGKVSLREPKVGT